MNQNTHNKTEDDNDNIEVSKSELKRQSTAKQDLGLKLADLSIKQLDELGISNTLKQAIIQFQKIRNKGSRAYGALKRQKQYVGKLMRNIDQEELTIIQEHFSKLDHHAQQENQRFHEMEAWRDRLLKEEDKAIDALYELLPNLDFSHRQNLRQIIRQHQKEMLKTSKVDNEGRPLRAPKTARQMFRYLRESVFID